MAWESVVSQYRTFAGVEIPSAQGLESTQIGHSGSLSRTSAVGSQSGRSIVGPTIIAVPFSFRIVLAPAYADYAADIRDTLAAETR